VDRGVVEAELRELLLRPVAAVGDRVEDAGPVRDVAARVLVEERVQEDEAGAADARVAVHQRDLAEHAGVVVLPQLLSDQVGAAARAHLDRPAALEAELEVADHVPREGERHRRADDALRPAAVRRREDLLRRHVDDVAATVDRLLEGGAPPRAADQPDREVGARPPEAQAVEAALVQVRGARDELVDVRAPGLDRLGLVEAGRRRDGVPEPLHVRLAEDRGRPALVRERDDRPVDQPLVRRLDVALGQLAHAGLADASAVEVGEELGLGVADDLDQGAVLLRQVVDPGERPRRRPAEAVVRCELDARAAHVLVRVVDVDVRGAVLVGDACDRAGERGVLGKRGHPHHLPRADVRADLDGEAGVALESLLRGHGAEAYPGRC
jgi:hypothetical protein